MQKTSKATQTADRAADLYSSARENPYVQRLIEDDELRDSLENAYEAAKGAYGRATGNGKGPVKAVTSDRKVQRDLRDAAENLRDATEQLRAPKKRKKSKLGRLVLFAVVGAVVALVVSEDARKTVLDALFGAEEEFEYTSHQHQRRVDWVEAATKERELSGEKAQRIIDAMRESVASRGAAGSTFEQVAREAGVSRGLLHYYFGTKERLLVEVVRRDTEIRVARLDAPLEGPRLWTTSSTSSSPA